MAGDRYDLIAYLFFLKDWMRFTPIAPTVFDKAFKLLGIDLVTTRSCSWENYSAYNSALVSVQQALKDVASVEDTRLIDAHSFCWMLVRLKLPEAPPKAIISPPKSLSNFEPAAPSACAHDQYNDFDTVTDKDFAKRDAQRRKLGRLAQDIALESERKRLHDEGHANPEAIAIPVWEQPGRGYDILSQEADGTPRHIEVKAARNSGEKISFFLSRNEWNKSHILPNYYFYLVLGTESHNPSVIEITGAKLSNESLIPVNFFAVISPVD